MTEQEIKEAFETADQHNWSANEMEVYDYWSAKKGDEICQLITAEKKGIAKGIAKGKVEGLAEGEKKGIAKGKAEGLAEGLAEGEKKGIEKGKKERAIEIAKNCIKQGMDTTTIKAITGLSIDEIEKLKQ